MKIFYSTILAVDLGFMLQQKARRAPWASLFYCSLGLLLIACSPDPREQFVQHAFSGPTMGTQYHINIVLRHGEKLAGDIEQRIVDRLESINHIMSTYVETSEISAINTNQNGEWIIVSDPLFSVLSTAQAVSKISNGAFDITVGPLVNLWGFGTEYRADDQLPSDQDIATTLTQIGYEGLELDPAQKKIRKRPGLSLDLSAVAKGYGADEIGRLLQSQGIHNFMVEIGGELMARGHNRLGEAWKIGIESPSLDHSGVQQVIAITDRGVATSGEYRNYFEREGRRYSHTIDPLTGRPITHNLASVTVVANNAAEADALATAINVLGYAVGKKLAENYDLAVYFILREDNSFISDHTVAFSQFLSRG